MAKIPFPAFGDSMCTSIITTGAFAGSDSAMDATFFATSPRPPAYQSGFPFAGFSRCTYWTVKPFSGRILAYASAYASVRAASPADPPPVLFRCPALKITCVFAMNRLR
jgi:hypothetical protein